MYLRKGSIYGCRTIHPNMDYQAIFEEYNLPCLVIKQSDKYLFKATDIGKLLKIVNIRSVQICQEYKCKVKVSTPGGEQESMFFTEQGVKQLIGKTRKGNARLLAEILGVDVLNQISPPVETQTITNIMKAFQHEQMIQQYKVQSYRIDLYFPKYKLAVECDEKHHNSTDNKLKDKQRQDDIRNVLNCTFIRYKPYDYNFDIFYIINEIYEHILLYSEKSRTVCTNTIGCQTCEIENDNESESTTETNSEIDQGAIFNEFIDECCFVKPGVQVSSSNIQGAFRLWARKAERATFLAFNDYLKTRFKPCRMRIQNKERVENGFDGVCLQRTEQDFVISSPPCDVEIFLHQSCKINPGSNVLTSSLVKEYIQWKKRVGKYVKSDKEETDDINNYLKDKPYALKAVLWNIHGNGTGYYGIHLKSDDMYKCTNTSSTAKKVCKYDQDGNLLDSWSTIAKAAQHEGICQAKMSRIIKNKTEHNGCTFTTS